MSVLSSFLGMGKRLRQISDKLDQHSRALAAINKRLAQADLKAPAAGEQGSDADWQIGAYGNFSLLLNRRSLVDATLLDTGFWDIPQMERLFGLASRMGDGRTTFLDIGSYFGLYAFAALDTGRCAQVMAFEANQLNYWQLLANYRMNFDRCQTLSVHFNAVSDREGVSFSQCTSDNRGAARIGASEARGAMPCPNIVLDSALEKLEGENLVIKIDVEGHEASVLQGMRNLLSRNRVVMQVEVWQPNLPRVTAALEGIGLVAQGSIEEDLYFTKGLPAD
ncbi:MAG: FkbM family methyltransferase [Pseudomonadota bacterium]|jgi:FkbM family methyltransferase